MDLALFFLCLDIAQTPDHTRISKQKARERLNPLYDRFALHKDDWRISKQNFRRN